MILHQIESVDLQKMRQAANMKEAALSLSLKYKTRTKNHAQRR